MLSTKKAITSRRIAAKNHAERMAKLHAEAQAIVATGKCPHCGRKLRQNLAITGWWQCSQYGAEGFRADATQPSCNFQTFTH